jgi:hypothetical protein
MPRGGKRPGAGAPLGNLNAFKHGRRSRQFAELGALVAQSPIARDTLLAIAGRWDMEKKKADYVASRIMATIIARGIKRGADGRLFVPPPDADGHSIVESALNQAPLNPENNEEFFETAPHNQKPSRP